MFVQKYPHSELDYWSFSAHWPSTFPTLIVVCAKRCEKLSIEDITY
ncbi:MAG: hypothetical protein OSB05_03205 [Akkermansiaceae bacterium]|nr:hypothetical protein [Akkermansiaceae bacterium]